MSTSDQDLPWAELDDQGRQTLTLEQVAGRLDHRLHAPEIGIPELRAGCQLAADHRLAAITCRPQHIAHAASHLDGTAVAVVSGLGFANPAAPTDAPAWVEEAEALAAAGATELAVVATAARLSKDAPAPFVAAVERLVELGQSRGFRLRVHLDVRDLTDQQVIGICRDLAAAGVWMVQTGSWLGERAGFRHAVLMREALGTAVLLKWTSPVPSLHVLLLAIAEGIDRFNADVPQILQQAARQASLAPLLVPKAGLDY